MTVWNSGLQILLTRFSAATVDGVATIDIPVPEGGRHISGARVWFLNKTVGDWATMQIIDGNANVVASYSDPGVAEGNRGWYLNPVAETELRSLRETTLIQGGLTIRIIATKGDLSADTFQGNLIWGVEPS